MKRLFENIRASFVWVKAINLASKSDYEAAIEKLDNISSVYAGQRVRYHMLRGFLEFATDSFSESIKNYSIAKQLLRKSNSYTEDDRNYLNCYISIYGNLSQSYVDANGQAPFAPVDYTSVNLGKVSGFIKSQFPLKDHPYWNESHRG